MLEVKDIHKQYQTGSYIQKALDGVSLSLRDNEFVAILGPSGSGKTTLLNIIGGLDRYDSGDLIINNVSTKKYRDKDWDGYRNHCVGFIFQSYNLIPHQSVLANVELALTIGGISKSQRRQRAINALEKVGLKEHINKLPNQLSGGQMQRVAIARALVNDPEIVLADEPTGALDTETGIQVMELLKEVAKDRLVVMVTHNPELANEYANRIVQLKDGKIISDTNPYQKEETEIINKANTGKASMSFLTALSLSFHNLLSKKARTLLVAFAGSIGIIGIALILALSSGVNQYIKETEESTLSQYPLQIQKSGFDLSSMMETKTIDNQEDKINEVAVLGTLLSSMSENDLYSFKEYIEENIDEVDKYAKAIEYELDIEPQIYRLNEDNEVIKVGEELLEEDSSSLSSMFSTSTYTIFKKLPDNQDLYLNDYDLKLGSWPSKANECILILSSNSISDLYLVALGLKEESQEAKSWDYSDFIGLAYKVINSSDLYTYDSQLNIFSDHSSDSTYLKKLYDKAKDLTIVGVAISKGEDTAILDTGVYYTSALIDEIADYANSSEVVKAQLETAKINVLSGKEFGEESDIELNFSNLFTVDQNAVQEAFIVDSNALNIDTSSFSDFSGIDFNKLISDNLDSNSLNIDLSNLNIELDYKILADGLTKLISEYSEYSKKDNSTNYANLSSDISTYLNSDEFSSILNQTINETINNNSNEILTNERLQEIISAVMANFNETYDQELDYNTNLQNYLSLESSQEVLSGQLSNLVQEIANNNQLSEDELSSLLQEISDSYTAYAKENDLADPSKFSQSFEEFMNDEGQTIINETITNSLNMDSLSKQLSESMQASTASISTALEKVMNILGNSLAERISLTLQSTMLNLPSAISIDEEKLSSAFSMNMDENDLQALLSSLMSSSTSLKKNLKNFGYIEESDISQITIYPYDFDSKQELNNFINKYNDLQETSNNKEKAIIYSDLVGLMMSSISDIINTISYVLIAFVAISLLVSSIMIGVITYISVYERQKEIGILRAMGAAKNNIANIFNAETFITGLLAGLIGMGISHLLLIPANFLIHKISGNTSVNAYIPIKANIILIVLATLLTMLGGLLPAKKAAKSDPVAALRSE